MSETFSEPNPNIKPDNLVEAKQVGHKLYQWAYGHFAEDVDVTAEEIENELQGYGLPAEKAKAALRAMQTEAEYWLSDISENADEEQRQYLSIVNQKIIGALFEVQDRQWDREDKEKGL